MTGDRDPGADLAVVLRYHQRTKHRPRRYARSLGYLDWANQPDPFRRFEGAACIDLELTRLHLLKAADTRQLAGALSCEQYGIAADGVFACAMLADFAEALDVHGAWAYRLLHWEAGLIGQVLYLEAEAAGVRATGIGCYFDDETADALGRRGRSIQVLYHFTVGGPVEDGRLVTHAPYAHLDPLLKRFGT